MWTNFPIFGGFDDRSDIAFNSENLINLFLIGDPQCEGKKRFAFIGTPGLQEAMIVKNGESEARALTTYENSMYGVFGSDVYRFTQPLTKSKIGTIGTTHGFVSIASNNNQQLVFTDGSEGYLYNTSTNVFSLIDITAPASAGFPPIPTNVVTLNSFFVVPDGASRKFQVSAFNDGSKWDVLDFAQIQAYSGENVGVGVVNKRLFFFKTDSTEIWYPAINPETQYGFPFKADNNIVFNFGCMAASSIASDFGYLFWLARDKNGVGSVMMTTGETPIRVSEEDESIENLIASFTDPADVRSYIYKDLGHIFLVITWNTDDTTLVYNVALNKWHKMEMHKTLNNPAVPFSGKVRHLSNCHAYFNDKHYIGSYKSSILYEFSRQFSTNAGEEIRRLRTCAHFFDENYRVMQINSLQLDMQMGIGLSGSPVVGDDPQVYLRISRDGGSTYGNYHAASVGKIGNRRARAIFRRLGLCRDFVAEFTFYDPVLPVALLGASINYEVLDK